MLPLADPELTVDTDVTTSVIALSLSLVDAPATTPPAPLAAEDPETGEVEVTVTRMEPELPEGGLDTLLAVLLDALDPAPAAEPAALERLVVAGLAELEEVWPGAATTAVPDEAPCR